MNYEETSELLTRGRVLDPKLAPADTDGGDAAVIAVWQELLAALPYADCKRALDEHYQASPWSITPSEVHKAVRVVQRQRLAAAGHVDYPPDLTPAQEREYRITWQSAVKRGVPAAQATRNADRLLGIQRSDAPMVPAPARLRQLVAGATIGKDVQS